MTVRADKPQQEEQQLDFDAGDITDLIECALDQTDFDGQACNTPNAIPSTYNARLTVGVDESQATSEGRVFSHIYDEPTIKKGVDDKCGLFGALAVGDSDHEGNTVTEAVQACGLVTDIGDDGKNYIAQTASDSSVALVGPKNSYFNVAQANRVVTLRLLPLAGKNQITVGWTISRENTAAGSAPGSRRLRAVQHVAYTLGADGSVSKSTSFGVLPAVRDSDGVSAVTTKEQITVEKLDADGKVTSTEVYNQTTVQHEKSGEDHPGRARHRVRRARIRRRHRRRLLRRLRFAQRRPRRRKQLQHRGRWVLGPPAAVQPQTGLPPATFESRNILTY